MKLKHTFTAILIAACLAACAGPSGPQPYTTTPGKLLVTELGSDRKPLGSWTVDAATVKVDANTDVLTAPEIPHPLRIYRTLELQ